MSPTSYRTAPPRVRGTPIVAGDRTSVKQHSPSSRVIPELGLLMQTIRNSRSPLLFALVALSGLLGGLLTPGVASAQNPPPPPPKHEGTAELAFVGTTGNSKEQTLSAGAESVSYTHLTLPTSDLV